MEFGSGKREALLFLPLNPTSTQDQNMDVRRGKAWVVGVQDVQPNPGGSICREKLQSLRAGERGRGT